MRDISSIVRNDVTRTLGPWPSSGWGTGFTRPSLGRRGRQRALRSLATAHSWRAPVCVRPCFRHIRMVRRGRRSTVVHGVAGEHLRACRGSRWVLHRGRRPRTVCRGLGHEGCQGPTGGLQPLTHEACQPPSDLPVVLHQFGSPVRLADLSTRPELGHPRLDVHDRSSVDGVEARQVDTRSIDTEDPADGHPQAVRTILGSLSEDSDLWPLDPSSRMTRHPRLIP